MGKAREALLSAGSGVWAVMERCLALPPSIRLCRVVFQIDFFGQGDNFVVVIVTACRADVVRAFQLATVGAFVGVCGGQAVVGAAVVAARFRHFVLLHSHWIGPSVSGRAASGAVACFVSPGDLAKRGRTERKFCRPVGRDVRLGKGLTHVQPKMT